MHNPKPRRQRLRKIFARVMPRLGLYVLAFQGAVVWSACIDDGGEERELDCAWLVDSSNCWRQALREAQQCAASGSGSFNASKTMCTFSDGTEVSSRGTLGASGSVWDFSINFGSNACMSFDSSSSNSFSVITDSGAVDVSGDGRSLNVVCPDGDSYFTEDTAVLFDECTSGFDSLPSFAASTGSTVSFTLGNNTQLFTCGP